jgi:hypothetical protein
MNTNKEDLKNQANELNSNIIPDYNGKYYKWYVIKMYNCNREEYYILQKRPYTVRKNNILNDTSIIEKIKNLKLEGKSLNSIKDTTGISIYMIKKILNNSI